MNLKEFHFRKALSIAKYCKLLTPKSIYFLVFYYSLSIANALFEGASFLLLVELILGNRGLENQTVIFRTVTGILEKIGLPLDYVVMYFSVILLFCIKVVINFLSAVVDGHMDANLRRIIQNKGFSHVLNGEWETLRSIRVGESVGAVTQESHHSALYIISLIKSLYCLLAFSVLSIMAMLVSVEITLVFVIMGLPIAILLKNLFGKQAYLAGQMTTERQGLYANITERLNVLLQIKVEGNTNYHIAKGIRNQSELTRLEKKLWLISGYIQSINLSLPAIVLLIFYLWSLFKGQPLSEVLSVIAGVGIIGSRALNQIYMLNGNLGNVTRYSGSIAIVYGLFRIPRVSSKIAIEEKIQGIEVANVSYSYGKKSAVEGIRFSTYIGKPLVMMGPSGGGKTTVANLVTGLMNPGSGAIEYVGVSGKKYNSITYKARIGYVTQDILLFHGTVKENLISSSNNVGDDVLWDCLMKTGADNFVRESGGLDAVITEAGKSLSGGEKRRLGIARVLTSDPHILILDEVTAGLDNAMRDDLIKTIKKLATSLVVIIITHDMGFAHSGDYALYHI